MLTVYAACLFSKMSRICSLFVLFLEVTYIDICRHWQVQFLSGKYLYSFSDLLRFPVPLIDCAKCKRYMIWLHCLSRWFLLHSWWTEERSRRCAMEEEKIKKVAIVGFFAQWKYEDVNDGWTLVVHFPSVVYLRFAYDFFALSQDWRLKNERHFAFAYFKYFLHFYFISEKTRLLKSNRSSYSSKRENVLFFA
jgi:hypothetical protein